MNRHKITKALLTGALVTGAWRAESVLACAACYGQSDSPLAEGMNWGIFTLLGVVAGVLGGIALFFVHIGRRSADSGQAAERAGNTD
jgi:hypothetical protein